MCRVADDEKEDFLRPPELMLEATAPPHASGEEGGEGGEAGGEGGDEDGEGGGEGGGEDGGASVRLLEPDLVWVARYAAPSPASRHRRYDLPLLSQ